MPTVIKGWKAEIWSTATAGGQTLYKIGYAESATVDIDSAVDEFLAVGEWSPVAIAEGPRILTGTLSEAWVDNTHVAFIYGDVTTHEQFKWQLYVYNTTNNLYIWAYDCLIESLSLDIPADGFLTQDVDFRATYWVYGSF